MPSTILLFGLLLIYVAITGRLIAFLNGAKAASSLFTAKAGSDALSGETTPPIAGEGDLPPGDPDHPIA